MPKILIADEDPAVRVLVENALTGSGVQILSALTGAEAVAQIEREAPDLVVCDVYMPDMDGYRVCEFVKSHPRLGAVPVLLLADVVDAMVQARAARVRPNDILRKPFAADLLLGRIRSLLPPASLADPAPSSGEAIPAAASTGGDLPTGGDLKDVLDHLAALPGVALSVLVDGEGFLIERAGEMAPEAEWVGAVIARLAGSAGGIAGELGHGRPLGMSLEYDDGFVLLSEAGDRATLGIVCHDPAMLDTVRRAMAQAVPACCGQAGTTMGAA
jgi:CheY-like chemotaxis protein